MFKFKKYTYPDGKIAYVQGYEPFALDDLIKLGITDILTCRSEVPSIWYLGKDEKRHRYFVDIYIPSLNKMIEVKSFYTYNKYLEKTYEYLNLKHYNVNETSSFDLIDDDLFEDDGIINNNIPSDLYSKKPELISKDNPIVGYKKSFNINEDYQILKNFRKKVYNILLETHNIMMVNNLLVETLHPENDIAKLYTSCKSCMPCIQNRFKICFT